MTRDPKAEFEHPDQAAFGPAPFWFWNDKLDEAELRAQVRRMAGAGVRNFVMHARWGLKTPYLSGEWWRMVGAAVDEARQLGSRAWVYDEYNYPSGVGGFKLTRKERLRERFLVFERGATRGGRPLALKAPAGKPVAAYAYPLKDARLDPSRARPLPAPHRGLIRWTPPDAGAWRAYAFALQVEPFEGVGRYSPNYLAPELGREFIRLTHEAYWKRFKKDFGKAIPAFFLDEPRFNNALPWEERFAAWFKRDRGYDPRPLLPLLLEEGGPGTAKFRQDYYSQLAELYSRHFFQPIGRWCRAHKVDLTGHLMAEETLGGQTRFSGQGMRPYRHFSWPGADLLGKGIGGLAPKMAASAAWLTRAPRVSCEAFAGCGWDFHPDEMNAMTNWLYSQGVNLMVPHAFFYAARTKRQRGDWPPSMFFQWEHWAAYPAYARRVARLSQQLSHGRVKADIALYHPSAAFQAAYVPDPAYKTGYFAKGPRLTPAAQAIEAGFQKAAQGLSQAHRDYVILDDAALSQLGAFKVLVLAPGAMPSRLATARIRAFKRSGGKVLDLSSESAEAFELAKCVRRLDKLSGVPDIQLKMSPTLSGKVLELHPRIQDPYLHQGLKAQLRRGAVCSLHYQKAGEDLYYFASLSRKPCHVSAQLRCAAPRVELRWPADGKVEAAPARPLSRGRTQVDFTLPPLGALLVAFRR